MKLILYIGVVFLLSVSAISYDINITTSLRNDEASKTSGIFVSTEIKNSQSRISNGVTAQNNSMPFSVNIKIKISKKKFLLCGGSIISDKWILTAAYCTYNHRVQDMSIYIGSNYLSKGKLYKPTRKLEHPKFVLKTLEHNLALLRLDKGLKWSPSVKYIILDTELTSRKTFAVTVGWGKTSQSSRGPSEQLQAALLTTTKCPDRYNIPGYVCSDKSLGAGLCAGDQGNALYDYVTSRLIGVSSISSGCGTKGRNSPDVYTSVAEYYYWITETANANYN